jgi:hypothetical protein
MTIKRLLTLVWLLVPASFDVISKKTACPPTPRFQWRGSRSPINRAPIFTERYLAIVDRPPPTGTIAPVT